MASVSVLLLTHAGGPEIDDILDTLVPDTDRLDRVIVTGLSAESPEVERANQHPVFDHDVDLVLVPEAGDSVAVAINSARAKIEPDVDRWVWILHDDSLPTPGALRALTEAARRSSKVGVVGPKLVRDTDERVLVGVGHHLTQTGREVEADAPDMVDQGQFDSRNDVLGVPIPGMLIRSDVLEDIGGLDPAFSFGTEGVDVSWRSHLRGHRVVVAPGAVVVQGLVGLGREHPRWHRRHLRQVALARTAWWRSIWFTLRMIVTGLLAALGFLLVRRGGAAAGEFADVRAALNPGPRWGARWRFRGKRVVSDRDLKSLFASTAAGWRSAVDTAQEAILPDEERVAEAPAQRGPVETGPVADEAVGIDDSVEGKRHWWSGWLVTAIIVSAIAGLLSWRDLLGGLSGSGVSGAELLPVAGGFDQGWQAWSRGWTGQGLGTSGPEALWVLPMSAVAWVITALPIGVSSSQSLAVATTWVLFASIPLSVLSAYWAARVTTSRRGVRALMGLAWASLSPLAVGIGQGRLGPVVVHVLAPLMVAGIIVAISRSSGPRGTSAAFGAALSISIAVWFVPGVLAFAVLASVALLVGAPGRAKLRSLVVLLVPIALAGPAVLAAWGNPGLLAGGAGATSVDMAPAGWEMALMHPGGPVSFIMWWTVPAWLLAVVGVVMVGRHQRRAALLLTAAALGLLTAVLVTRVGLTLVPAGYSDAGEVVTAWPGTILSLAGACIGLAAAAGADAVLERRGSAVDAPTLFSARSLGSVLLGVAGIAIGALLLWRAVTPPPSLELAEPAVSPIVAEQINSSDAARYLQLTPSGPQDAYVVGYGLQGQETGPWLRDRVGESLEAQAANDANLQSRVGDLVDAQADAIASGTLSNGALADLAVGFISVKAEQDHPLVVQLDQIEGLTRITAPPGEVLWRVVANADIPAAARARVFDASGAELAPLAITGGHSEVAQTDLPTSAATVVVSEGNGWQSAATVTADGVSLSPDAATWPLTYEVPQGAEKVAISLPVLHEWWWIGTGVAAVFVLFFALPLGSARNGRKS